MLPFSTFVSPQRLFEFWRKGCSEKLQVVTCGHDQWLIGAIGSGFGTQAGQYVGPSQDLDLRRYNYPLGSRVVKRWPTKNNDLPTG